MSRLEPLNSPEPRDLVAELLALQPYVEHLLCDGSREPQARAAAKDHVQTVLRKAIQHLPAYQPHKEGLRPWLTRITRNAKVDEYRNSRRHDDLFGPDQVDADFVPDTCSSPEREAQVHALLEKALAIIEDMPPDMQDVLVFSVFCEDSHAEIAAQLGISEHAAKMRLSRARQLLRKRAGTIDDHIGAWLLALVRRFDISRLPMFRFLWSVGHLVPPVLLWFVASPQLEVPLTIPTENVVVASSTTNTAMDVPDNRHDVAVSGHAVVVAPANATALPNERPVKPRAPDKPRKRPQIPRDFHVDVPPVSALLSDRQ